MLNLCINDACKHNDTKNLFGFLNRLAILFSFIEQNNTVNERISLKKLILDGGQEKNLYFGFLKKNNVYFYCHYPL